MDLKTEVLASLRTRGGRYDKAHEKRHPERGLVWRSQRTVPAVTYFVNNRWHKIQALGAARGLPPNQSSRVQSKTIQVPYARSGISEGCRILSTGLGC